MIRVPRVPEPLNFGEAVKVRGNAWLAANPTRSRPPPLWLDHVGALASGFRDRCGYGAMYVPTDGTVDHYLGIRDHRQLSYEWANYRYVSASMNASKKNADHTVLDPYEVAEGWFEVILPSLQLCVTNRLPSNLKAKAEFTLKRLKLRDGEKVLRQRQAWYRMYREGKLTLEGLDEVAPLIADAVRREAAADRHLRRAR